MSNIHIPEPCHAKWRNMTSTEGGRFCANCQKTVHDFTKWEVEDITAYLKKETSQVCGRFNSNIITKPTSKVNYKSKIVAYVMGIVMFIISSCRSKTVIQGGPVLINGDTLYNCTHQDIKTLDFEHKPNINDSNRVK